MQWIQETLVVGPFRCNCQILVCVATGQAVLVDPGDEASRILQKIQELSAQIKKRFRFNGLYTRMLILIILEPLQKFLMRLKTLRFNWHFTQEIKHYVKL